VLITMLSVPGCPNLAVLSERVEQARGQILDPHAVVVVEDEDQAQAWRMPGSPTLLLDGFDPFDIAPGASLSCRLYLGADGRASGTPDLERVRRALRMAANRRALTDSSWLAPVSDCGGWVRAAYPFCLVPSRHRVRILDGAAVWAMCAIDALGIGPMLRRDTVIESTDPLTGQRIRIECRAERVAWEPGSAVVFAGRRAGSGRAELACCDLINFFASEHSAARWAALRPDVVGCVLDQSRAAELGRSIFAGVFEPQRTERRPRGS
jgi:hypothetical protein